MPTAKPIIAASVGAKVATSRKFATKVTNSTPVPTPTMAVRIGSPAAMTDPKAISKMTRAKITPMISLLGGSPPAKSRTWPSAPTAKESEFVSSINPRIAAASSIGSPSVPSPTNETDA